MEIQRRTALGIYAMAAIGLADQLTKWMVLEHVNVHHIIKVNDFLNIVLVWNKGVTFGLLSHIGNGKTIPYVFIVIATVITILLGRWLWRTASTPTALSLGFIMGGAIGNAIDRVRYGMVVDFIDFHYGEKFHWYAFNLADAAIVSGVVILLIDDLLRAK
ncbi:MAG: signal peptidase II [Alphaproteobacteria bacterium]|nr:signal peptidase II [Alphaproteobacteria bacterium]